MSMVSVINGVLQEFLGYSDEFTSATYLVLASIYFATSLVAIMDLQLDQKDNNLKTII